MAQMGQPWPLAPSVLSRQVADWCNSALDQIIELMPVSELTSRDAVLAALDEFQRIGRPSFLEKYGFGEAKSY
jgi:hypothetical protein